MGFFHGWSKRRARAHLVFLLLVLAAGRTWVWARGDHPPSRPPVPPAFSVGRIAAMGEREKWVRGLPMDLSRVGEDDLRRIPGVGPALARRIMEWMREHGVPRRVEELRAVKGVGPVLLKALERSLAAAPPG